MFTSKTSPTFALFALLLGSFLLYHYLLAPTWLPQKPEKACSLWTGLQILNQSIQLYCIEKEQKELQKNIRQASNACAPLQWKPITQNGMLLHITSLSPCKLQKKELPNPTKLLLGIPVSLHRISESELIQFLRLPKKVATKIVEKTRKGKVHSWQDIREIRGVGAKTLKKLKKALSLP